MSQNDIVAKRTDAPYRSGDDRAAVKIKNYRTIDCVIGGFRDRSIGSTHDELLLGLYDRAGPALRFDQADLLSQILPLGERALAAHEVKKSEIDRQA